MPSHTYTIKSTASCRKHLGLGFKYLVGYLLIAQLLQLFMFSAVRGFMIKGSSDSCEMLNFVFYPSSSKWKKKVTPNEGGTRV